MRDGPVRRAAKGVALAIFVATTAVDRLLVRLFQPSPFLLGGACRACGACCEAPSIRLGLLAWHLPSWRRAVLAWHEHVNGFLLVGTDRKERMLTFRCTHFDATARRCDSYASRPGMCRDYPRLLLFQSRPELLPGCGYRPVARDAKRFLKVLDAQPMDAAQREKLKRELFLDTGDDDGASGLSP